jgi:hypothetical protein
MNAATAEWARAGLDAAAQAALAQGLPASQLWSLLLGVAEQRAVARRPAEVLRQWSGDRFVAPCAVDQRTLLAQDNVLLRVAQRFEAIELSPLAPLGTCAAVAPGSQNRIVSALRGTEVVSDPTNVLALVCAERLRANTTLEVRLATSQRCVRAQPVPPRSGFAPHFRLFCLASAAHEQADHAVAMDAAVEHLALHLEALDALQAEGYAFGVRVVRLLASDARQHLAQRLQERLLVLRPSLTIERAPLAAGYYDGLRFMVDVHTAAGERVPLIDGGLLDWLHKLAGNDKLTLVASGLGSQLAATLFFERGSA